LLGTPLAWWLAFSRRRWKVIVEAVVALPLVLPPTVLGFYLLLAMAPQGFLGELWMSITGNPLAFTFSGLVIASILYSLPFVIQPLQGAFQSMGRSLLEASWTLGSPPWRTFFNTVLPNCRHGFLTAAVLSFAHTLGEFGVVLMVGGNIPGETRVVSIAIYDHVESMAYGEAHRLSLLLLAFSFVMLLMVYWQNRHWKLASEG
ncbi:MAG TPA: molybdate ABC transporter permease subunit, partial [Chromatiaceae bacterium]|nr:molybdate ABC transporter permease subunit [Chromatiaceae bacterium]